MSAIDQFFHNGDGVALDIYSDNPSMAHAITAWGFTYNAALKPTDPKLLHGRLRDRFPTIRSCTTIRARIPITLHTTR